MPLWVPQKGSLLRQTNIGSVGAAAYGTGITVGVGSAKGAITQLLASANFDACWVRVSASGYALSGAASGGCLDIMIGGAGSEIVLIPDLLMGNCGTPTAARRGPKVWDFPLYVPSGSRVSARVSGDRSSVACTVGIELRGAVGTPPWRVAQKITTYGVVSTTSGTSVTPGSTGVEGAWTEISSGTSVPHFAFLPSWQVQGNATMSTLNYSVDIGLGAATEVEIGGPYIYATDTTESMDGSLFGTIPIWCDAPAATRLVMRASCNGTPDTGAQGVIHALS